MALANATSRQQVTTDFFYPTLSHVEDLTLNFIPIPKPRSLKAKRSESFIHPTNTAYYTKINSFTLNLEHNGCLRQAHHDKDAQASPVRFFPQKARATSDLELT